MRLSLAEPRYTRRDMDSNKPVRRRAMSRGHISAHPRSFCCLAKTKIKFRRSQQFVVTVVIVVIFSRKEYLVFVFLSRSSPPIQFGNDSSIVASPEGRWRRREFQGMHHRSSI